MLLKDSPVARKVRAVILDVVQAASPMQPPANPSGQPKLNPSIADLSVLTITELKRLFQYRLSIESGSFVAQQLVEDIDPIFWEADFKSVAIAFEQHCLNLEENYVRLIEQDVKTTKRSIRLRKKYIATLSNGLMPSLIPDFGRYYRTAMFEEDDRWTTNSFKYLAR